MADNNKKTNYPVGSKLPLRTSLSKKQKCCIRPCNSGDPAFTETDAMEKEFENMFCEFSNIFNKVNFVCKPQVGRVPYTTKGSCPEVRDNPNNPRETLRGCRECDNNNVQSQITQAEEAFDNAFSAFSPNYREANGFCPGNVGAVPYGMRSANRGDNALGNCKEDDNNNAQSIFNQQEWLFDTQFQMGRPKKCKCNNKRNCKCYKRY